jgi:hypothetical protein
MNEVHGTRPGGGAPWDCGDVREWLPDHVAGRLDAEARSGVEAHLSACASCAEELELVRLLHAGRPRVPEELPDRILEAVRGEAVRRPRASARRPWWGLSAAAVAAIALGIGIASDDSTSIPSSPPETLASEFEEGEFWVSDDGLLAGAPSLEGLSDEALMELLEELNTEGPGGSA